MPRGDKSKYTDKQERKADHIAEGYEKRGVSETEAERRAWATVNKDDGGAKKSGSGRGKSTGHPAAHKGGKLGGKAESSPTAAERSASAKKAAATRKRNAAHAHSGGRRPSRLPASKGGAAVASAAGGVDLPAPVRYVSAG